MQMLKHFIRHLIKVILSITQGCKTEEKLLQSLKRRFGRTQVRKVVYKLLIFVYVFRIVKTSRRKNLTGLRICKIDTTSTKGILCAFKSLLVISISLEIRFLGTFSLCLSFSKIGLRFDSTFVSISHVLRDKTIGISLRGLGRFLGGTLVEFLNTGSLLVNIRNGVNLGVLGSDLIHNSAEATRKKFVVLNTLDNIKNFVRLIDTNSLGLNFQTISIR